MKAKEYVPESITRGTHSAVKTKALMLSLIAIATAFIIELGGGLLTNSLAVLTDSIHAAFDAVVTAMLIMMTKLAQKPRDIEHTYGHGRLETLGGFIGGIILFMIAIFFAYESLIRLVVSTPVVTPGIVGFFAVFYALAIAVFRIVVLRRATRRISSGETVKAGLYDAVSDLGSTAVALVGIWLASVGIYGADPFAALVLAAMLLFLSSRLAYRNAMELTDAIHPSLVNKVRDATIKTEGVLECQDVKMRKVSSDIFVELTVSLTGNINFEKAHAISANVEKNVKKAIGANTVTVHFEPEYRDVPLESMIGEVSMGIDGVKGVHNISASKIPDGIVISLHVQVDRDLKLVDAHNIADKVEMALKDRITSIKNVTVHLEPLLPHIQQSDQVGDSSIEEGVRRIIQERKEIKSISNIITYKNEDVLKIDVHCVFGINLSIEHIHEIVSEVERQIRAMFGNAVVTIHPEPAQGTYT